MRLVYDVASWSKDPRTQIGTVIVKGRRIVTTGYNGLPEGVDDDLPERWERPLKYLLVSHSERNAIDQAAKMGTSSLEGAKLYTFGVPCVECAKGIIQVGIKEVITHKQWEQVSAKWGEQQKWTRQMFVESGVLLRTVDGPINMHIHTILNGKEVF